ncbi:MAG TPA: transcription antitermination factor NusB [Fimbriimonadaceae bacterium]|nr:transcription antitermination factor NusB [Fimbriimonadaceae bacterium]
MPTSRRKARIAALQALYKIEIAKSPIATAVEEMRTHGDLSPFLADYAERLIAGVRNNQAPLDKRLSAIIREYDYDRVAVVDKNMLRIAAFELLFEPSIPPAVTINEAIEIARKFSTEESGKFVNGVLGKLLEESPKVNWDPSSAPPEEQEEIVHDDEPVEVEEQTLDADSEEAKKLSRIGGWKLRE